MDRQMQPSGKGFVRRLAVLLGSAALLLPLAAEPVRQHTSAAALYLLTMAATTMATPAQAQTAPRITSIELVGDANPLTTVTELKWRVTFNQTVQNQTATFNWQVSGAGVSSVTVTQRRIDGSNWGTSNGIALDRSNRWEVTASGTFQPGTVTLSLNTPSRVFPEGSSFNDADQLTNTTPTGTSQPTFTLYQSVVSITADETEIQEGDAVSYTLRRTGDTTDSLTVQLFVDRSGVTFDPPITGLVPVTFPATQDTVTTTLQTADDETYSPGSEGLIGASIFSDTQTPALYRSTSGTFADAVTVTDDDPPPVVTLGLSPSTIDEDGGTSMVTATLDRPSATGIDIDVSLEPGAPASLGSQNLLIIQGGNTEVVQLFDTNGNPISPVTITATDNDVDAPDVTVEVRGSVRNRGAIANPDPVTLTIADDDPGVVEIRRHTPSTSPTNATQVTWNIFFSEVLDPGTVSNFDFKVDVDGVEIADEDFLVGKLEITNDAFNEQGIFYLLTVTVRNVLDNLNGSTVTLNFDPNQSITTVDGDPLVDTTPTGRNENTYVVDNVAPTPTITIPATSDRPFIATIEFDEPVTGFQESSITVGNAMLSGFTEVTQGEVWSVLVTPTATGAVTLSLTADSVQDAVENGNVAAQASSTYTAPAAGTTVSGQEIWSATLTARGLAGGSAGCTRTGFGAIKCSDPSTLSDTDFILNGDTHTIFSMGFSNTESRIDITPGLDEDFRGDSYTITFDGGTEIPVGVISDGSRFSNSMLGVALSNGQDYTLKLFRTPADDIAPTVTSIVRQDPTTATTNADSLTWRVTFDEAVVNVDAADFTLEGTTATLSVEAVDGETGVYDVTASGGDLAELDGTVTLSFASGQNIADAAGNALTNTEPTVDEATYQVDNVPTVKSIIRLTPPTSPTDADSLTWRVTFSEVVENFTADDFTLTGTTAVITNVEEVSGETGVFDVTASGGNLADVNGTVTLGFAATQDIEDASGNALANTAPTDTDDTSFDVDNIPPTVEITDVPGTSSRAFTATISFSEPVTGSEIGTGFAIGDITAVNGMLSEFTETTPGTVWTVRVTPTASGTVRLSVAADAVRDDVGNPNTASNTASSTYTAPLSISVSGTEIWSATLNAQSTGLDTLGCNTANFSPAKRCSTAAALSDNDFILDDNTYTITIIGYTSSLSDFDIITEPSLAESLRDDEYVLTIDGTEVPLDYGRSTVSTTFKFSNPNIDLDLTSGQDYALKLFRADTTPPAVTSITRLTPEASVTNADQLTWRVTFSEVVANVDAADFQVDGTTTSLSITGSGATWDVTATGGDLADLNGTVTLEFASGQDIANAKGNVLADTAPTGTNESNYMLDNTAPTPTITGVPQGSYRPFTAAITFSEPVTGFVIGDITATNATLSQFSETTSDTVWTVQVAPIADGQVTLNIAASVATDAGNNGNTAANASSTYTAPTPPPGIEIWSGTLTVRQLNAFSLGCSISSATTTNRCSDSSTLTDDDFELGGVDYDIVLLNRVTIQATDNFQLRVAPALPDAFDATALAVTVDGQVLTVTRTDVQDLNTNALSTQLKKSSPGFTWTAGQEVEVKLFYNDTTSPRVASIERQDPTTEATAADSLTWRVTFDEDVQNVDAADFEVAGATATLTVVAATASTVFDVTASGGDLADVNGTVTLGFASGQDMEDLAGNRLANTTPTGTNDNSYELDNPPTVMIDVPATRPNNNPFTVTITFSEPVSGFVQGDITVANGTLSAFTATTTDTIWTVLVTPTEDSDVTLDIAAGVATDATGNANTAATQATSAYEIDTTAPTVVSITRQMPTTSPTNADSLTWRVTFDEAVVNVDSADFMVTGTDATLAVQPVAGETGVYDVTASGGNLAGLNGTMTLNFTSTQNIEDRADNALAETAPTGTNNNSYEVDNTAPTVGIDVLATSNAPFTATITFSKMVSNFMESHITVNNATLSGFTESTTNPGTVWTVLVTPTADGMVTLDIAAGVAEDVAGNENTAATQATSTYTTPLMDTTALTVVSITRQMPTTSATNADSLTWRVTFSEAVMNVDSADFTVVGTTASLSVSQATGQPNAWDVTASGGDLANLDGTVTLAFAGDQNIQDEAGNALDTTTPPTPNHNNYQVDNIAPTVGISVPTASNGPFTAIITFREVVSGFGQSHITVGNGTLSSFVETTPGRTWTVLVMPTADGMVTLDIAAGVVMDEAGNENTAAPQAISTYSASAMDTTAPTVVSITRQMPTTSATNADSLTWRVVFSEVVMNVDGTHFMVAGTTASLSVSQVTGQRNAWDVTASGGDLVSFNGTVTLAFAPGLDIQDQAGNPLATTPPPSTNDNSYEVDNVVPAVRYPALPDALVVGMPITPLMPSSMDNDIASYRYSATGLPAGLVIDEITGIISGTPFRLSVTPAMVMVTVSDHAGNSAIVPLPFPPVAADQPGVSVSPVSLSLNEGATTSYTVTLNTPPTGPVTITPTSDDTNTVNVSPNHLTFITTNWNVPQTVMVAALEGDNAINEMVTIRHTVSGADYDAITAAAVQVTVNDNDTVAALIEAKTVLNQVVLPNLVQQLTAETTEVITSRLNTIASGLPTGTPHTLSLDEVVADTVAAIYGQREHLKNGSLDWRQALSGRDFALPLSSLNVAQGDSAGAISGEGPFSTLALWGGGNYSTYRNIIEATDVNGNGFSGMIGMDLQPIPQLVTGLALTTSQWELDYATDVTDGSAEEGTYNVDVTMVNPYVSWSATEQLSLWATFGYGHGQVEQDSEEENPTTRTDRDDLTSWAGGIHFEVIPTMDPLTGQGAPFGLAFKADGATSSFLDTSAQLVRLAAEVSHSFAVENSLLTAALELGWRIRSVSDHGNLDGQQLTVADKNSNSGGAELAGSLNWRNTDGSLSATVNTRVFLGSGHHREWGIGGHLRFTSSRHNEEGLSLTLQPSFGVTGTRLEELWSLSGNGDLAVNNDPPATRLDARLAYGFPLANAILTPYTEVAWEEGGSTYGAGLRYGLSPSLELDLKGVRHSNADGNSEHRLLLQVYSDL